MKRYRFVIYALKGIAGLKAVESLECSTLLETVRKGKHAGFVIYNAISFPWRTVYKTHEEIED